MGYRLAPKEQRKMRLTAELERILNILRVRDVEKVVLFGSLVSGNVTSTSDIDLLIVERTKKRFLERLDDLYSQLQPTVALDILVYTPEEIESLEHSSVFIRSILKNGRVLYEKGSS